MSAPREVREAAGDGDSGDDHECIYRTLQCHKCSGTGKDPRFAAGYAEGRASERADMLAFVEEACRLGTQGDALLRALMAKGRHEGAASIVAKKDPAMAAELRALREVAEAAREVAGYHRVYGTETIQDVNVDALRAALAKVPR